MISLDRTLAKITRRLAPVPGAKRLIEPLRRLSVARAQRLPDPRTLMRDFDGDLALHVDLSAHVGSMIYWYGYHSTDELHVLDRLLKPDMVFVDVGANLGEFTLYAAKRLPQGRVVSFEPVERCYDELRENVALNDFHNVTLHNVALADRPGTNDMYEPADTTPQGARHEGLATFYQTALRARRIDSVPVRTLDEIFPDLGLSRLDVLKVDVEGAELPVLRGASRTLETYRPDVLIEVNADTCRAAGYTPDDLLAFLAERGYRFEFVCGHSRTEPVGGRSLPALCNLLCRAAATE